MPPQGATCPIAHRLAPLRASFIGGTRAQVATLFWPDGDLRLEQTTAHDMSLAPPRVAITTLEAVLSWNPGLVLLKVHAPPMAINSHLTPTDAARIAKYLPDLHVDVPVRLKDIDILAQRARRP